MFMKLEFGKIFLKCKRKSVKYPQRKFMKLSLLKIDCENCGKTFKKLEIREKHIVEEYGKMLSSFRNVIKY